MLKVQCAQVRKEEWENEELFLKKNVKCTRVLLTIYSIIVFKNTPITSMTDTIIHEKVSSGENIKKHVNTEYQKKSIFS